MAAFEYRQAQEIRDIMLKTVRLNTGNVEFTPRKPFDLLRDVKLVPLSGASGTPVELFVSQVAAFDRAMSGAVSALHAHHAARSGTRG